MAQRAENRVHYRVQVPAEVFGQKPQNEIAALLKQLVLASIPPVCGPVGEMLRTIQLHCHASVRTKEIHFMSFLRTRRQKILAAGGTIAGLIAVVAAVVWLLMMGTFNKVSTE